jgi:hypothetical protein
MLRCTCVEAQNIDGDLLMVEQGPPTPVKRPDRSNARRRATQLPAEILEYAHWHDLDRVQQPSGGLQEDDVQSHGQPVQRRSPSLGTGPLVRLKREQLLNLDWRRRIGKPIPPQIPVLPTAHRTPPGARYTGLNHQLRESCKINNPRACTKRATTAYSNSTGSLPSLFARPLRELQQDPRIRQGLCRCHRSQCGACCGTAPAAAEVRARAPLTWGRVQRVSWATSGVLLVEF